jgi:cysteinyl-tRNA synthetase
MAKSKGNVKTLSDLAERGYDPLAFRYFFLQAHYRQQQTFNGESMAAAARGYSRLVALAADLRAVEGPGDPDQQAAHRAQFCEAMADDLNAPKALAVLWDVVRSGTLAPADQRDLLLDFDTVLGLDLAHAERPQESYDSDPRIDGLLEEREAARVGRDFATADRIRDELAAEGVELIDTPEGPRWRRT